MKRIIQIGLRALTVMPSSRWFAGLCLGGLLAFGAADLSHAATIGFFEESVDLRGDYALAGDVSPVASPEDRLEYGSEIGSFSALTRAILHAGHCICENLRHFLAFRHPVSTDNQAPVLPVSAAPAAMFLFMTGLVTVAGVARLQYNGPVSSSCPAPRKEALGSLSPGYLLLLSHDARLAESLTSSLGRYGYSLECMPTARDAGALFARQAPALVLVDRTLSGWQTLRQADRFRTVPMMTVGPAGSGLAEDACVSDLDHGMDSTHICDEGSRLLVAKVRALLRRSAWMTETHPVVRAGNVELDAAGCEVRVAGQAHHLPPVQFKLLRLLMDSPDIVFRRRELIDLIWGQDYIVEEHTLDVHMFWLRRLLSRDPQGRQAIVTVRGVGIKFVINREEPHSTLKGGDSRPVKRGHRATCRVSKRPAKRAVMGAAPVRVAV